MAVKRDKEAVEEMTCMGILDLQPQNKEKIDAQSIMGAGCCGDFSFCHTTRP
jgi:hypothetical protein